MTNTAVTPLICGECGEGNYSQFGEMQAHCTHCTHVVTVAHDILPNLDEGENVAYFHGLLSVVVGE